ncbi:MAG TPA: MFS transporter [Polyangiaceae bacterium]|nr:MFS transporter [Polyangiaceae bacterium]
MSRALLWLLATVQLTLLLDFMRLMPLGPQLLRSLHLSAERFGWAVSAYTLASALSGLCGFFLIDRWPLRRALLLLYATFLSATLACGTVSTFAGLLAARVTAGAAAGLLWSVILALIVGSVAEQQRGRAFGLVMTSYSVSSLEGTG